jgi:hypothetical protein
VADLGGVVRFYDRLAKDLLMEVFGSASLDLVPERELSADAQRLDLWCVPDEAKLGALAPFGLLQRIATEGPCAFEFFHQAPSFDEIVSSLRKAFYLRQPARLPPRKDEPWLWIVAGGRPNQVIATLDFRPESGWPTGLYAVAPWLRARLIVTSELPRTDETLLLRMLGAGKTLRLAQADLATRVSTDPVAAVALPIMVRLHLEYLDHPEQPVDPETLEFLMATSDIYAKWQEKFREEGKAEGKAEGEASALLAVLSARGLTVSEDQVAQIRSCNDLERLERWLRRAVSASSTQEVLSSS